ncbi:hypothetical protein Tco_0295749, partial [Tanacetum coccineum]
VADKAFCIIVRATTLLLRYHYSINAPETSYSAAIHFGGVTDANKKFDLVNPQCPNESLEEFKQPEVNEYGPRDSGLKPTNVCNKESNNSKENTDDSLTQQPKTVNETSSVVTPLKVDKDWREKFFHPANQVRVEEPKKARENIDAPIIEDWVSDDEEEVESIPKEEKKADVPITTKKESVKPVNPSRRPNVNTVRARGFNAVKPSACWVWRPIKPNEQLPINEKDLWLVYVKAHVWNTLLTSQISKNLMEDLLLLVEEAKWRKITGKVKDKTHQELQIHAFLPCFLSQKTKEKFLKALSDLIGGIGPIVQCGSTGKTRRFDEGNWLVNGNKAMTWCQGTYLRERGMTMMKSLLQVLELRHKNIPGLMHPFWVLQSTQNGCQKCFPIWSNGERACMYSDVVSMGELTFFLGIAGPQRKEKASLSVKIICHEILRKFNSQRSCQDPDIMFVVCAYARFQVSPKTSHLLAVKRIFRYLKGKPSLGLWYSKDSPLELVAYTDSDYAGATLDRKSTIGGCQFLGNRLISWQCKKQTVVATSTTEAEYVAAASVWTVLVVTPHKNCSSVHHVIDNQDIDLVQEQTATGPKQTAMHLSKKTVVCVLYQTILEVAEADTDDNGEVKIRIRVLEADLMKTKKTYSSAYTKLILRVKKLEYFSKDWERQGAKLGLFFQMMKSLKMILPNRGGSYLMKSEKASDEISTVGAKQGTASEEVPRVSTAEVNLSTTGGTITYSRRSAEKRSRQDKGKAIMIKEEPKKKSKKELEQERLSYAEAIRLEEQMNKEHQIARNEEIARQWDEEEIKRDMDKAKSAKKIDWNDPSVIRYHTQKLKPKIVWDFNQNIEPMDAEHGNEKQKSPAKEKSPEKIVEEEVDTQEVVKEVVKEPGAKRKKSIPRKSTRKRQKLEEDAEKEELKGLLDILPREEFPIEVESISTNSKNYKILSEMLEDFDRPDVEELYRLVKERYSTSRPEGFDLMLWGDLHTLFKPDEDDEIWKDQHEYKLLSWRLYDFSGIHILLRENGLAIHMLTEKKYPLNQEMLTKMLSRKLEVDYESSQAFELLKFIRSQVQK